MKTKNRDLFTTIKTEGALLPVDILQNISEAKGEGLKPEDYHLYSEKLNEAISYSWNKLLGAWMSFKSSLSKLPETEIGTTVTRERWLLPLFQELGYGRLTLSKSFEINDKSYPISHSWQNTPIHLVGCRVDLDRRTQGVSGASKTSPHSLVQEFLNRSDDHLWAFVSNGYKLRVLRDNVTITRQSYVEFDIQSMMEGEVYSDFVVLWLLCHVSRVESEKPEQCWLEKWSKSAKDQGTRALDDLRKGVENAIKALGNGFLSYSGNKSLRDKLRTGELTSQDYYRELLRMVYRLIFLFVAEDRDLLLLPNTDQVTKERYLKYYSTSRLRKLSERKKGTKHIDLWKGLSILFDKLGSDNGCPELGLPALGSFLWSEKAIENIRLNDISNYFLLEAITSLSFTEQNKIRRPVDYRNLGSEELGSIYEALLELHPDINIDVAQFNLDSTAGNERKTTGSYYTPTSLINCLLDSALDPVIDEAIKKPDPEKAILDLKICDPACGSGHFLVGAAHRLAKRLASVRTGDPEPSPNYVRKALRDVIGRCIYGVDINPMSVELCKVSLWMEAIEPGKPLSFLDHHIKCGNSLLGTTPFLLEKGIPDEAFNAIEGDDKKFCTDYKKKNKEEKKGQQSLFAPDLQPWESLGNFASSMVNLNDISDDTIEGIHKKQKTYEELVNSGNYLSGHLLADAWCASFVWKKVKTEELPYPITEDIFRKIEKNPHSISSWMKDEIIRLSKQYQFFHFHLEFPDVFSVTNKSNGSQIFHNNEQTGWDGGFDVVLGNPPWERVKLQEKEWFASRNPEIANAINASVRKKMIEGLKDNDPSLYNDFQEAIRQAEGESSFVRTSSKYPLCGRGDVNTYTIFTELNRTIINPFGRVGCIVPSGIATDDTTKFFFQDIMDNYSLVSFYDFENREAIFQGVHRSFKFALITMSGKNSKISQGADFLFFALNIEDLRDENKHFTLTAEDIKLLNPNTRTCPIFRSKKDAELTKSVYRRVPVLIKEEPEENPWGISFMRMFDMSNDSHLFHTKEQLEEKGYELKGNKFYKENQVFLPLYEGRLGHQFNHRFAIEPSGNLREVLCSELENPSFLTEGKFFVQEYEFIKKVENRKGTKTSFLGHRRVSSNTNERTSISCIFPYLPSSYGWILSLNQSSENNSILCSNYNSFIFDYLLRNSLSQPSIPQSTFQQLPVLTPETYEKNCTWSINQLLKDWILPRVLELTYTAWDLQDFAKDFGYDDSPFVWDEERRFLLRCELDACYFHLYGINRDDVDYIMETFPIVKKKDEKNYGEYKTKRVILEIFDSMSKAIESGEDYQTLLNPQPADPSVSHKK